MTLVQLRHLLSLAATGSFSQSAAALFLTQPALSRSIRALESEFGQPLFDRLGRRSELTPFGRETVQRAQALVAAADDLRDSAGRIGDAQEGQLRIGMGSGPGALLMTPLLLALARDRPRLRVEVAGAGTGLLVQALRDRALDALVVDARSMRPAPDLRLHQLHALRGAFLVRPSHPLLRLRAAVGFDALLRYPIASTPLSDEAERYRASSTFGRMLLRLLMLPTARCHRVAGLSTISATISATIPAWAFDRRRSEAI